MKKNKAIAVVVIMALFLGLLTYTAAVGFGPTGTGSARNITTGLDLSGGVSITYQAVGDETPSSEDMSDTVYKLQQRVQQYSTEAQVYQEGTDRINIEIPGVTDANAILEDLGSPGALYFISETDSEGNTNYSFNGTEYALDKTLEEIEADGGIIMTGTDVASAESAISEDQTTKAREYVVNMVLTDEGAEKFAEATQKAYEDNETIGIYYDGQFISVPSVENGAITGGRCEINGMDSKEEADNLASFIRIGGLKIELEELRSNVVGAQLGEEAISTSVKAGAIGLAIVILFMILVYLLPGVVAGISLLIYTALMLVMLNAFDITLTLPGIAGIILSIGMAVDANVIIYARIREEIAAGKSVQSSIKTGFQKALSAIVDGNITTLIAALVLGLMGTGSVKGFAQTLAMGIVLSMFTALVISRLLTNAFFALGLKDEKFYGRQKERKTIDFLAKRKICFVISLVLVIGGPVAMLIYSNGSEGKALNYSLEFMGGTSTSVTFNEDLSIADIDSQVKPVVQEVTGDANIQTQKVAGSNQVIIKTRELTLDERQELNDKMVENFDVDESLITAESISSTVSSEMRSDAIVAVIVATICMLIYIWFRFKDIRFAASAVIALVHDVLVVLTFYAIARVSVGNTFIACMLTIVGYSINATIVIFDRIRENLKTMSRKDTIENVVNVSITQTLTRSIYTSFTTFVMVAVLYVMGVASIREFALPLIVGILCGAYSSVCITGALWYEMRTRLGKKA